MGYLLDELGVLGNAVNERRLGDEFKDVLNDGGREFSSIAVMDLCWQVNLVVGRTSYYFSMEELCERQDIVLPTSFNGMFKSHPQENNICQVSRHAILNCFSLGLMLASTLPFWSCIRHVHHRSTITTVFSQHPKPY